MNSDRIEESSYTWDMIAESFDHTRNKTWDFCTNFISNLSKNSIAADLGCGNGRHLIPLAKQCKQAIGFDISVQLLQITAKKIKNNHLKNVSLIQGDLCLLPFQSNSFDHVIYIAALHNIKQRKNRIQSLQQLHQVLTPKGSALVSVWSRHQKRFHKQLQSNHNNKESGDITLYWRQHNLNIPRFYHLYDKQEFKEDLITAGFTIQSLNEVSIISKDNADNYYAIITKESC